MKIRKGFVSNSSSSSFICEVCGEDVSGMDIGLAEAEMVECKGGHTFCEGHQSESVLTEEQMKKVLDEQGVELDEDDDIECAYEDWRYESEWRYEVPKAECTICQLSTVTDGVMLAYLLKKYCGDQKDTVTKEVQDKFSSLDELSEWDGT